jgi:hypothetical protein
MINVVYSTEHWIVPRIVMGVLVVLLLAIIITEGRARVSEGGSFLAKPGRFFIDGYYKVKLWGTLIPFAGYIFVIDKVGFTVTSMIFVLLFNLLYAGLGKKQVLVSVIIAIVAPLIISIMFGVVFNITLPKGMCSITFVDYGFTIY